MSGNGILSLLRFIHLLSLATWDGALIFLFLVVTPTLQGVLSDDLGRRVAGRLFPSYYGLASACGASALASLVAIMSVQGDPGWFWWRIVLLISMILLSLLAAWRIQPGIDALLLQAPSFDPRGDGASASRRLGELQRLSMQVNGAVLLMGLTSLWLTAGGPG